MITLSSTCKPKSVTCQHHDSERVDGEGSKHLVCGYVASCKILSTNNHASGSSLNYCKASAKPSITKSTAAQERSYLVEGSLSSFLLNIKRVSRYSLILDGRSSIPSPHGLRRRCGLSRQALQWLEPSSRCVLQKCDLFLQR